MTKFGEFLQERNISYTVAAVALGCTRSYVSMLANGKSLPSLVVAGQISEWTREEVPMSSWYAYAKENGLDG